MSKNGYQTKAELPEFLASGFEYCGSRIVSVNRLRGAIFLCGEEQKSFIPLTQTPHFHFAYHHLHKKVFAREPEVESYRSYVQRRLSHEGKSVENYSELIDKLSEQGVERAEEVGCAWVYRRLLHPWPPHLWYIADGLHRLSAYHAMGATQVSVHLLRSKLRWPLSYAVDFWYRVIP